MIWNSRRDSALRLGGVTGNRPPPDRYGIILSRHLRQLVARHISRNLRARRAWAGPDREYVDALAISPLTRAYLAEQPDVGTRVVPSADTLTSS